MKPFFYLSAALILFFHVALATQATAQNVENVDTAFQEARELAFEGKREQARKIAYAILEISPNYHGVRILIARTYSWDQKYREARRELNYVLEQEPNHKDALSASIDNEIWAERPQQAVEVATEATRLHPVDVPLQLKKAEALIANNQPQQANSTLDIVDNLNPSNVQSSQLRIAIRTDRMKYTLTGSHTQDWFTDIFDSAAKSNLQLGRATRYGSVIGRINYSNRFNSNGLQPEIDFYPSLIDGWYGYLNVGFTTSSLYPRFRFGAEIYKNLPRGFEASVGFRYLNFQNSSVTIYTGSLSKYWRSWYFSARPFFTPSSVGFSRSLNLTARYYVAGPENYITLSGGFGFSPEERRFQDVQGDVFLVQSQYIGISGFKKLRYNLAIFGGIDLANQELTFDPGNHIQIYTLNVGIQFKF